MRFFDITILGIYLLINPFYVFFDIKNDRFDAKDHSLYLVLFIHSANINNILRYFISNYFNYALIVMAIMYLFLLRVYIIKNRFNKIISIKNPLKKDILIVFFTIIYSFISILLFFKD